MTALTNKRCLFVKGCTQAFGSLYELQASGFDPTKLVGESKGDIKSEQGWTEQVLSAKDTSDFDAVSLTTTSSSKTLDEVTS